MIKAEIIADSINSMGNRITTYILTFPRFILAELNTHRVFSKNSASSRAIPFKTMLEKVETDPFIPIAWQKSHKGMQGTEYIKSSSEIREREQLWIAAKDRAVELATKLYSADVTKQLCNRLLEPFMWHTVILTATEFENFFNLRCPQYEIDGKTYRSMQDAFNDIQDVEHPCWNWTLLECLQNNKGQSEIHMMALAEAMWDAMNESTPKELQAGEWHIPFGDKFDEDRIKSLFSGIGGTLKDYNEAMIDYKVMIATARCARVSYLNFEGKDDYEADIKLFNRLKDLNHWSPFEHCARAMSETEFSSYIRSEACSVDYGNLVIDDIIYLQRSFQENNFGWCRNYRGFVQLRAEMDKM